MSVARLEHSEPQAPAFTGMALDRAVTLRTDADWVSQRLSDPRSRAVAAGAEGVLLEGSEEPRLVRNPLPTGTAPLVEPILLGIEGDAALFAIDLDAMEPVDRERFTDGRPLVGLRDAGALLSRSEGGLAAYLSALLNWHRRHRFCANCGARTLLAEAGYSRRCPSCGAVHFPRTDPVVIMIVEHAGRLLLGRRPQWPPRRYSALAGFVSPGESLEEAVIREVGEESSIEAYDPRFVASQPWAFPSSLMLGFEARSDGGDPIARDGELEDVGWFDLDLVRAAAEDGASDASWDRPSAPNSAGPLLLPPPVSIARFLIDRWVQRHVNARR
jgi:NAD+ diphosphatase